jgi:hypothetical protein
MGKHMPASRKRQFTIQNLMGAKLWNILENNALSSQFLELRPPPAPTHLPPWVSVAWEPGHGKLFQELFSLIKTRALYFNTHQARAEPCFRLKSPQELQLIFDLSLSSQNPIGSPSEMISLWEKVIQYSPHLSHPFYLDGGGLDPIGLIGDWLGTLMSVPVRTFLSAGVFELMEKEVCKILRNINFLNSIFCPFVGST